MALELSPNGNLRNFASFLPKVSWGDDRGRAVSL